MNHNKKIKILHHNIILNYMIKNLPSDLQSLIYSYDKPIKNTLQKIFTIYH